MASHSEVHVLLLEDDEVDIKAVQRAFKQSKIANPLHLARDGVEALEKLRSGEIPKPYMILMDLNMPRMDGITFMQEIRKDENLKRAIVFVLTTSKSEEDKVQAYDLNAAGYIIKSDFGDSFMKAIAMLDSYWKVIEFPNN